MVARGWESKSVEDQQSQFAVYGNDPKPHLSADQISKSRVRQGLLLNRAHTLQQLLAAQNPKHRSMLETALADLDAKIAQLG